MIGSTLGHYKILEKLGEGGMGEVYRAEDTRLDRDVAIKVVTEAFATDHERVARFEREAKVLASLNHSHIAQIYGLEKHEGQQFLVLELVEGPTLSERVAQGPISLDNALRVALQVAEALESAHERGIVHRDLKPANVKLTPAGAVKVLDFGLAKPTMDVTATDLSVSPTLTAHMTQPGVILGTAAYMSPEQARGHEVDRRTDIWAFGCLLYELLSGRKVFGGESVTDLLAAIVTADPDWSVLPEQTPRRIRDLLRRCLEKDPHLRLQHMGDARIEIGELIDRPVSEATLSPSSDSQPRPLTRRLIIGLAILATTALGWAIWSWSVIRTFDAAPPPTARAQISLPNGSRPASARSPSVALSPNGTHLVVAALTGDSSQLYIKSMERFEFEPIPGTQGARSPFFSPNGEWVGFVAKGKLQKVALSGGAPMALCDATERTLGASWGPDDFIVFTPDVASGLLRVQAGGGVPEEVTRPIAERGEVGHNWPEILPDGRTVLFTLQTSEGFSIAILSLDTGQWNTLIEHGTMPRYSASGHLIYAAEGGLRAVPFDPDSLASDLTPVPVLDGVVTFTVSRNGSLVYPPATADAARGALVWVDRLGVATPLSETPGNYSSPRLSPDGVHLAINVQSSRAADIWTYDLERHTRSRLTVEGNINNFLVWTPDGQRITFNSTRTNHGIYWKAADGSGNAAQLLERTHPQLPGSWSPDGRALVFTLLDPSTRDDLWVLQIGDENEPLPLLATPFRERAPRISPDGYWLAYVSDDSGQDEVYVQPYPGPGARWTLSADGGTEPVWSLDGSELFYRSGERLMAVTIESEPDFKAGRPTVLFEGQYDNAAAFGHPNYDVSPDGQSFVMIRTERNEEQVHLNVVFNWFEELRRLAPI